MLDLLLTNGVVRTFDTAGRAEAVGIADGRIPGTSRTTEDAPAARRTIDLRGRPAHPRDHRQPQPPSPRIRSRRREPRGRTRPHRGPATDRRARGPPVPTSTGSAPRTPSTPRLTGRRPNATDLRGLTDRPVFITTYDQHSVWLNDAALRVLGIDHGTQIPWGRPEFDDDGAPTGWVTDFYTSAMTRAGLAGLQRDIPMYSPDRRYRRITSSLEMATASGITTVVEPQVPLAELDLMYRARAEGRMNSRVITALFHPVGADAAFRRDLREAVDSAPVDDMLRLGPVKLYADDVIEPHTAAMLSDYANRPGHRGAPSLPPHEFTAMLTELDRLGFQTAHPRDRRLGYPAGARLDRARRPRERDGRPAARHRPRRMPPSRGPSPLPGARRGRGDAAAALLADLVAGTWMENVGEDRWDRAWRFRSLAESGAALAFSSDWQVGEMDPLRRPVLRPHPLGPGRPDRLDSARTDGPGFGVAGIQPGAARGRGTPRTSSE